ncbi:hypothetical protein DRE_01366 [Drechslerella stenobrocha 248]|uniref:HMG box domain-containing protein n=1 Tax=Drechslerella stenobrocha 248 TaxID=1043628 RepID=W7HLS2_9PEZI|nr:hypothetical protein DRE_01366 [Drechslerella stenobrocha 248]
MSQESPINEFDGSIDFLGRPSLSRASSMADFYSSMHQIPSSFFSPATTNYSTDECMTPEYSVSEYDYEPSYQLPMQQISQSKKYYNHHQEKCTKNLQPVLDRMRPTSAYIRQEPMNFSPPRLVIEAPPTPASSTEGLVIRSSESATRSRFNRSTNRSSARSEKGSPILDSNPDCAPKVQKKRKPPTASKAEKPKVPKLDKPLSELTKDYADLPIRDMERWVHRSLDERKKEVEKRDGHVARPMNSFMLYRSAFAERTKMWCLQNNHQVVSSVSGASWPLEPAWIREKYNELARIERINHQAAHPGYKFSPSKNQPPPMRRRKTSSDVDDETGIYSTDEGEFGDQEPEHMYISQLVHTKRQSARQRPKAGDMRKRAMPLEEATPATIPMELSQEQPLEMGLSLRLQTGAQKSSYEALNPGRPAPVNMISTDTSGTYYQTIVRPTASTSVGSAMIEDVTIRKTAAPATVASNCIKNVADEVQKHEEYYRFQQQQQRLSQEPLIAAKQDPLMMEQNFCVYTHEPTPEVDFEHYRGLLEQQVMQNIAAQQAYLLAHSEVDIPYAFIAPGLGYPFASSGEGRVGFGDDGVHPTGVVNYGGSGGPMWHSLDGNGGGFHSDPQNTVHYDDWLAE